jgi:Uma2 family endonuclease
MAVTTAHGSTAGPIREWDARARRWTSEEFHRACALGLFRTDERLELVRGVIFVRDPERRPRRWTRDEYYRAADLGILRPDERLELIDGEIIEKMSPQKRPHAIAITVGASILQTAFGFNCYISQQLPLRISDGSEPEPDLAVITGAPEDYVDHPSASDVRLLVEVSDTTLVGDRGKKAALYAEAGVADYWIENLPERKLEVCRDPAPLPDGSGFGYQSVASFSEEEIVIPLAAPQAEIRVADLLPPDRPVNKRKKEN